MYWFVIRPFQGRIERIVSRGSRKLDPRLLGFGPFRAFPRVVTHGWIPATATRFDMVLLLTVGCHPRLL